MFFFSPFSHNFPQYAILKRLQGQSTDPGKAWCKDMGFKSYAFCSLGLRAITWCPAGLATGTTLTDGVKLGERLESTMVPIWIHELLHQWSDRHPDNLDIDKKLNDPNLRE